MNQIRRRHGLLHLSGAGNANGMYMPVAGGGAYRNAIVHLQAGKIGRAEGYIMGVGRRTLYGIGLRTFRAVFHTTGLRSRTRVWIGVGLSRIGIRT